MVDDGPKTLARPRKGRLPGLTPMVVESIVESLQAGSTLKDAATLAGIHRNTLMEWMRKGRTADEADVRDVYRDFLDRIEIAMAQGKHRLVGIVAMAAEDDWAAAAWLLERKHSREFGARLKVDVGEKIDEFLAFLEQRLGPAALAEVKRAVLDFEQGEGPVVPAGSDPLGDGG